MLKLPGDELVTLELVHDPVIGHVLLPSPARELRRAGSLATNRLRVIPRRPAAAAGKPASDPQAGCDSSRG
jgi:hypothetical protein